MFYGVCRVCGAPARWENIEPPAWSLLEVPHFVVPSEFNVLQWLSAAASAKWGSDECKRTTSNLRSLRWQMVKTSQ